MEKQETPAAAPAAEAPKTEAPVAPVETPKTDKKGNKKGLMIGCAVGAVALVGGGIGIAYAVSNSPENIALSAISDFITAKNMTMSGTIAVQTNTTFSDAKVTIENTKTDSNEANTTATLSVTYNGTEYKIKLGSVVVKDYTLYVQLDGLKDAVKAAVKEAGDFGLAEYAEIYEDLIDNVVGEIDGVWWKISVPELVDEIEGIASSQKDQIKDVYNCLVDVADKASKKGDDYARIYKSNAFVKLDKHEGSETYAGKGTAYDLTLDAAKLTSFANAMADEVDGLGVQDCIKKADGISGVTGTYTKTEVKQEEVEKAIAELPKIVVTVDSGFFSHSLTGLYVHFGEEPEFVGNIELTFKKETAKVEAPSDAKPVTDLYKNVVKAYEDWQETAPCKVMKAEYPSYYASYCDPTTNKVKPEYQDQFNSVKL